MDLQIDPRIVSSKVDSSIANRKARDLQALKESSQEFESLLLMEMVKAMRKTIPEGGLFEKSMATETFTEMLDTQTAQAASKGQGLGIAEELYRQLAPQIEKRRLP